MSRRENLDPLKADITGARERSLEEQFRRLVQLVAVLRQECPWDRKQTPHSLAHLLLEESYELVHAIDLEDIPEMKKELGDLLLHVCFQASLAEEAGRFTFNEVIDSIVEKLVWRHPHVFGDASAETEQEVLRNWEGLKMKEGRKRLLEGVPKAMSELLRAYRVQKKVSGVGFDWPDADGVLDKLAEEMEELRRAESQEEREEEFGDLLFTLVNYSRHIGANPEDSLRKATGKFMTRFERVEQEVQASGKGWEDYSPEELDRLWRKAKGSLDEA